MSVSRLLSTPVSYSVFLSSSLFFSIFSPLSHLKKLATFLLSSVYDRFCDMPWKRPKRPLLYSVRVPI